MSKSHVGDGTIPVGGIHLAARADQAPVVQSVQTSYDETYFGQSFDGGGYRVTSFLSGSLTPNDYELNISQTVYTTLEPAGLSSGPNSWVTSAWRFEGALDFQLPGHTSPVQFVSSGGGPDALLIQHSATGDARNVARFEIDGEDLYPPHLLSFYYRANRYVFVSYANAGGPASSLTIESSDSDYSTALTDNEPGVEVYGISLTDFAVESHTTIQRGSSAFPRSTSSAGMGNLAVLIDYQGGSSATFAGKILPRENEDAFWHTGIVEVDPTFQHIHYIDIGHLVGASFSKTSGSDYIVAGTATSDSISGHPLSLASNNASVQVLFRIRQDGTVVWLREFENLSIHDMKYSRDDFIYIAASVEGSEVLDEWTVSPGTFGSVVASFSGSGVTRWAAGVENPDGAGFVRPKISIPSNEVIYFFTRKNVRSLFLDFGPSAEHGLYRITENFRSL